MYIYYNPYLTIAEVNQGYLFPAHFYKLALEKFPIEVHPWTAVLPWNWLPTCIICKKCHIHPTHKQCSKLNTTGIQAFNLKTQTMRFIRKYEYWLPVETMIIGISSGG